MLKEFLQLESRKDLELKNLYRLIHKNGPLTKIDLLQITKLKQTTLTRMLEDLLSQKLIRECGFAESSGGRPPILYEVDTSRHYIIGLDISRFKTRVFLMDLFFQPLEKTSFSMTSEHTPERTILKIKGIIQGFMVKYGFEVDQLLGIGIGAVGPLDRKTGVILNPEAFYAPGWENVSLVKWLQDIFPVKVLLTNGVHTAILGEIQQNSLMGKNTLYCISGEGLRCAVMMNGQLLHNKTGDSSSYGHMVIDVQGRECSCGKNGCLSSYISFQAIREEMNLLSSSNSMTVEQTMSLIRLRDPIAVKSVLKSAYYYGIGLANIINLLHPEVVVLSGPLIHDFDYPEYYDEVVKTATEYVYYFEREQIQFTQGSLKLDAGAIGAGVLVFESYFINS